MDGRLALCCLAALVCGLRLLRPLGLLRRGRLSLLLTLGVLLGGRLVAGNLVHCAGGRMRFDVGLPCGDRLTGIAGSRA